MITITQATYPVAGVCAIDGWTDNGRRLYARRLAELHGSEVPLLFNHEGTPEILEDKIEDKHIIGHAKTIWHHLVGFSVLNLKGDLGPASLGRLLW